MELTIFEPGDGTRYLVFCETVSWLGDEQYLFGFGVGSGPMQAHVFQQQGYLSYEYFESKMGFRGSNMTMPAYATFCHLSGREAEDGEINGTTSEWHADWRDQLEPGWQGGER